MRREVIAFVIALLLGGTLMVAIIPGTGESYPLDNFGTGVSVNLPTSGNFNFITSGLVDGDINIDIAFGAGQWGGSVTNTGLHVYTGDGAGTWNPASTGLPTVDNWGGLAFGDADGDGNIELYAGNEGWGDHGGGDKGVGAWEYAAGSWSSITSPYSGNGNYVNDLVLSNFTKGPGLDIAIATSNGDSDGIKVFNGSGGLGNTWTENSNGLPGSGEYTDIDVADLNKDGLPDIVAGAYSNTGIVCFTQNAGGAGWTQRALPDGSGGQVTGVKIGDVNNDGHQDIVFSRKSGKPTGLYFMLGNSGGMSGVDFLWTYMNQSWAGGRPGGIFYQLQLEDIDWDGDLDLLAAKSSSGLHLYLGNGSENPGNNFGWAEATGKGLPGTGSYYGSGFLDFDGDGDLDVAGATWGGGVKVFETDLILPPHPEARAGANQTVSLGGAVYLNGTNSTDAQDCPLGDVSGNILNYDWNITDQPVGSILTDNDLAPSDATAAPSFVPTHAGIYDLSLVVRDTDLHYSLSEDFISITVMGANTGPTAVAGIDQVADTGSEVTLNGSDSHDAESPLEILMFDWNISAGNPAPVILSDESDIAPVFTAPNVTGDYFFTLAVRDPQGAWSAEDEVKITVVLAPNVLPTADAGIDFSAYSNTSVTLNGSGSLDLDGIIVSWDWNCTSHPATVISNENSSAPSFTPNRTGQYIFTLSVKDDRSGWGTEDDVVVTVIEENRPPMVDAGEDFTTYFNEITSLNGSGSHDPEGYILSWDWNCTSHPSTLMLNMNSSRPTFIPDSLSKYVFTLRVMDDLGLWSLNTDTVNVTIMEKPKNLIPTADAGEDATFNITEKVVLSGNRSYDPDGNITSWLWNCTSHPALLLDRRNSSTPHFFAEEAGIYNFTLIVRDDQGGWSIEDLVVVTVLPKEDDITNETPNHPPIISLTTLRTSEDIAGTFRIKWAASDADNDNLTFTLELLDGDGNLKKVLGKNLSLAENWWDLNTTMETNGSYMLRLSVSDGTVSVQEVSSVFRIINDMGEDDDDDDDDGTNGTGGSGEGFFSSTAGISIIIVIVIIVIAAMVVFFIMRERRSKKDDYPSMQTDEMGRIDRGEKKTEREDIEEEGFDDWMDEEEDDDGDWADDAGEEDHDAWDGSSRTWDGRYGTGTMLDWDTKVERGGGKYRRDDDPCPEPKVEHSDDGNDDGYDNYDYDDGDFFEFDEEPYDEDSDDDYDDGDFFEYDEEPEYSSDEVDFDDDWDDDYDDD